ncbi:MAG: helicase-associated domain-containing protein [Alicyclobacillaceae bacterium]|nr:helicase-associated domain-containing protein [Alicyclobacillaceae bacterium]
MKLSECLNAADIRTLQRIAEHYELGCSRHSKLDLLQAILFAFGSRSFVEQHVADWGRGREAALLRLVMEGRHVFSAEELEAYFHGSAGAGAGTPELRLMRPATTSSAPVGEPAGPPGSWLDELTGEGWLFGTTHFGSRLMYCVPVELKQRIRAELLKRLSDRVRSCEQGPLTYREEAQAMARDLDVFLEYVRNHSVRLTTEGSMYKRNLQQVLELLEVAEEPLKGGWRFGYGRRFHDYPDRFALIYDFAYHQHMIEERDDGFLTVTNECQRWIQASPTDRQQSLVRFYLQLYRRAIARLPLVAQVIAHVAIRWVHGPSMMEQLSPFVNEYYYDSQEQVWNTRILKMLMHLGVIRLGWDEAGEPWFQMTKLGQQLLTPDAIPQTVDEAQERQRILIVQPNFEIVVTADQPLVTAELSTFAELRQAGVVRVYRISEDAVRRGLAGGGTVSGWLEFLQRHAQTPVPGNVERTLKEWEKVLDVTDGTLTS